MNFQVIIVGIIIAFAASYFGFMIWRKGKAFTLNKDCGSDCDCETK